MNLNLTARHIDITPHLRAHINTRFKKLAKFNRHIVEGEIVLFKDRASDIAEGRIHLNHTVITAKGRGTDLYFAVNDLAEKLLHQLQRYEGKLRDRKRLGRNR
ncbi:MAG: ribosome-associated translation inhibitor RaiA [candidate division WOR-3 bacterium]